MYVWVCVCVCVCVYLVVAKCGVGQVEPSSGYVCVYLVVAECGVGQVEPSSALRVVRPEDMSRQLLVVE